MGHEVELSVQLTHCDGLGVENVGVRCFEVAASRWKFAFQSGLRTL